LIANDGQKKLNVLLGQEAMGRSNGLFPYSAGELDDLLAVLCGYSWVPCASMCALTVCVTCGGWKRELTVEAGKTQSREEAKKGRGAHPPLAARIVSLLLTFQTQLLARNLRARCPFPPEFVVRQLLESSEISVNMPKQDVQFHLHH
jgi:hypothetical protein